MGSPFRNRQRKGHFPEEVTNVGAGQVGVGRKGQTTL